MLGCAGWHSLAVVAVCAQYRPLVLPERWEFSHATPAYAPDDADKKLGDFQAGLKVDVLGRDDASDRWRVRFKRYGSPDIVSLIDPPNLAQADPVAFERVAGLIAAFPLLQAQLEAREPWPDDPMELVERLSGVAGAYSVTSGTQRAPTVLSFDDGPAVRFWGLSPLAVYLDYTREKLPKLVIELWNKGDAFQSSLDPRRAAAQIESKLAALQSVFRTSRQDPGASSVSAAITAVRMSETVTLLPNDLRVSLRYKNGEYLIVEIESLDRLESLAPPVYDAASFESTLAGRVKSSEGGHRFVSGIPMIDQGEKGYCAAATLARVLQYYGYTVDVHALADLADTEAQFSEYDRGGTRRDDIISAMRRICNSTPFHLSRIDRAHPDAIRPVIERGFPILWFVPGHARLLIGIHPENNEIIYSDTWGAEYQYQVGSWEYFYNLNQEMWVLLPQ